MEHDNLVHGLLRKRAEIAGQIEAALKTVQEMHIDLAHIDATIRMFRPNADLSRVKVRPVTGAHPAESGEMLHGLLGMLRGANGPLTSKEMTARLVMAKGIDPTDENLCRMMHKRVATAMRTLKMKGMARCEKGHGLNLLWVAVAP